MIDLECIASKSARSREGLFKAKTALGMVLVNLAGWAGKSVFTRSEE